MSETQDRSDSPVEANNGGDGDTVEVMVPALYPDTEEEENKGEKPFQFKKEDMAYKLRPRHIRGKIVFYDAQDESFYYRTLEKPHLTVWFLVSKAGQNKLTYSLRRLFEVGWRKNIQVRFMDPRRFNLIVSHDQDVMDRIMYDGKQEPLPDAVVPRLGAKSTYFDLAVLRQLEKQGLTVLNPVSSLEITRDKLMTMQVLGGHGVLIPKTLALTFPLNIKMIEKELEFPIIMKLASGSQGSGVMKVESAESLADMADMLAQDRSIILQEFIKASSGRDIRCYVIGGKVVGAMMRCATKGFKANVHQGADVKAVDMSPQLEWLALETTKLTGLDIAGVDLLIDKNKYRICEINSSPGFEGFEKATKTSIPHLTFEYIKMRLGVAKYQRSKKRTNDIPATDETL